MVRKPKKQECEWVNSPGQLMPLRTFLKGIDPDPRIRPIHISVYLSLYRLWLNQHGENPIFIISYEVMGKAKISGSATWHRTIRDLHDFGYIRYEPTFNRTKKSKVYL